MTINIIFPHTYMSDMLYDDEYCFLYYTPYVGLTLLLFYLVVFFFSSDIRREKKYLKINNNKMYPRCIDLVDFFLKTKYYNACRFMCLFFVVVIYLNSEIPA